MRLAWIMSCSMALLAVGGCATRSVPGYSFAPENVQMLKEAGAGRVRVGEFRAATPQTETADLSTRGLNLASPTGSFAGYLREGLVLEFKEAGRYDTAAQVEVSGVLLKNKVDAAIGTGVGELAARFKVQRNNAVAYERDLKAGTTWESSFAGAVALPKAIAEYPRMVQELIGVLFRDRDFLAAIK